MHNWMLCCKEYLCWATAAVSRALRSILTVPVVGEGRLHVIPDWGPDGTLPLYEHDATWAEFVERFGWNPYRRQLLGRMLVALQHLRDAGCTRVYIGGSFVTSKSTPADYDVCWEPTGVDLRRLDPVFTDRTDLNGNRVHQKEKYGGEFLPADYIVRTTRDGRIVNLPSKEFFHFDKEGNMKGTIKIDLTIEGLL